MAIYEMQKEKLVPISTSFEIEQIYERDDIQRLLRDQIEIISPDTLIIAEEFNYWQDSKRRIDLLGLDNQGSLVVIELKRTMTGGFMDLQSLRYAAMISSLTPEQIYETYQVLLKKKGQGDLNAKEEIEKFVLEGHLNEIGNDVRIILASAEFDKEITTTVLWLNKFDLDIRCFKLIPYRLEEKLLLDVQQVIPLPEAEEYIIQVRKKLEQQKIIKESEREYKRFDLTINNQTFKKLAKRNLAYHVIREVFKRGISPQEIEDSLEWRNLWDGVEGEFKTEAEFITAIKIKNQNFDQIRYFTKSEELFIYLGKTYALSNQWGKKTLLAVDIFKERFNLDNLKYEETK